METAVAAAGPERTWQVWLVAALVAAVVLAALLIARRVLNRRLGRAAADPSAPQTTKALHALASSTWGVFLILLGLYAGARVLQVSGATLAWADRAITLAVFAQAANWAIAILNRLVLVRRGVEPEAGGAGEPLSAAAFLARLVILAVFALLALDNLGVNVSTLIAGLGITSLAVALALQNILGDLFASLSIHFDKPFEVGDSIAVDDLRGTVEHVGMRTTRLRSLTGEQLVVGNRDLLSSRIRNYKRMRDRRAVLNFGIVAGVPADLVARVPEVVKETVTAQEHARFDRAHLVSAQGGTLTFESVYYMRDPDYGVFMDTQQAIYLQLYRRFAELGLDFAYPTQKVLVEPGKVSAAGAAWGEGGDPDASRSPGPTRR